MEKAQLLAMVDLDMSLYVEYDDGTYEPLALIETAIDVGQTYKCAKVTTNLARRITPIIPCYVLLYKISMLANPEDSRVRDIESFRARRLWPKPEYAWQAYTPQQWAEFLCKLRRWSAGELDKEFMKKPDPAPVIPIAAMDASQAAWKAKTLAYYNGDLKPEEVSQHLKALRE